MTKQEYLDLGFDEKQIEILYKINNCEICNGIGYRIVKRKEIYNIAILCVCKKEYDEYTEKKEKEKKEYYKKNTIGWDDI